MKLGPWFKTGLTAWTCFENSGRKGWIISKNFNKVQNNLIYVKPPRYYNIHIAILTMPKSFTNGVGITTTTILVEGPIWQTSNIGERWINFKTNNTSNA